MNVLHINFSDRKGGAAIASFRLHNAMLRTGINSRMLVLQRTVRDRDDITTVSQTQLAMSLVTDVVEPLLVKPMSGGKGWFSSFMFGFDITGSAFFHEADVIYLHWIGKLVNFSILKKICKSGKPVFWFMHDMFPITGGCHHAFDCEKYKDRCNNCPCHINKPFYPDLSKSQFRKKHKLYRQFNNLHFIAPSRWMQECAKTSALTRDSQVFHIPNLIDGTVFKPLDRQFARRVYSLPVGKKIIGFGAERVLTNQFKGWKQFCETMQHLATLENIDCDEIFIVIFGSSYNRAIANALPFETIFTGYLADDWSLAVLYNALDVFVIPSLAENFPLTVEESLSCDTPVVGFNTGGIPDMVSNKTGYLAEYLNSGDMAKGIVQVLNNPPTNVRAQIEHLFADAMVKKHIDMLNGLVIDKK
jgi:glycosyltransferase involved in cell wall biosynthesis